MAGAHPAIDQYRALFDALIARLRAEFADELLGVLVSGSRIHGAPSATSDLDTHVLIAWPRRRRRNFVLDGVEIEMFVNPPWRIPGYFDERGVTQHMFAFGLAIYDPQGVVADLQAQARRSWDAGPPPIAPRDYWHHRYAPWDSLCDLIDVGDGDAATAALLRATVVERLLATHYRLNGRWPAKLKRRLADLAGWDPRAADLTRQALDAEPKRAIDMLAALGEYVLGPIGGWAGQEWAMDWEELDHE